MLSARTSRALDGIGNCSHNGHKIRNLFQIMTNHPDLWMQAYTNIYANKGAVTKGIDGITLDGFSDERVVNIIKLLKEDKFLFKPSKRVYIPKTNGKKRPLGLPSGDCKLVQEVSRLLLERIYEPTFSIHSHGFRPKRSCHTALETLTSTWDGMKWLLSVDIESFYDTINHNKMIELLERKIDDRRFIKMIKLMLKAGYIEGWEYHRTYSGTPQGGICSCLLSNIYLHELDKFIEEQMEEGNQGKRRKNNPEWNKLTARISRRKRKITKLKVNNQNSQEIETLKQEIKSVDLERKKIPKVNPYDPDYKRVKYIRYCDDFLVGVVGTKEEAKAIMKKIKEFVQTELLLKVSEDKSGITHAKEGVIFLGYIVKSYTGEKVVKTKINSVDTRMRSIVQRIQLHIPKHKTRRFCQLKGYGNYHEMRPTHRAELLNLSDLEIINIYNAEMRGFANYYNLASCCKNELSRLFYLATYSFLKTLAAKYKTSVKKTVSRLKQKGEYVIKYQTKKGFREIKLFQLKHLDVRKPLKGNVDKLPNTLIYMSRTELEERFKANQCDYCGKGWGYMEVHHVRKLSDIKGGKKPWEKLMIARRRKTLILCIECHHELTHGKLPGWKQNIYKMEVESAVLAN